jgi:hypothetical protein
MSELSVSDKDNAMFDALRRHHLRHPGTVSARVLKVLRRDTVSPSHIATARLEFLSLGLDKTITETFDSAGMKK